MFKDVDSFFRMIKSLPIYIKFLMGLFVVAIWGAGQFAFLNSQKAVEQSEAYTKAVSFLKDNSDVVSLVGQEIDISLVIGDPKEGHFIVKIVGSSSYTFAKVSFSGDDVNSISLKVSDSDASIFPEYMRGKWVQLKI